MFLVETTVPYTPFARIQVPGITSLKELCLKEQTMLGGSPEPIKKTWEELVAAASTETDPEKLGMLMEEMFAALELRERMSTRGEDHPTS